MTGLLERLSAVKLPEDTVTIEGIPGGAIEFKLRAMGHVRQAVLIASHPPRADNVVDRVLGYNPETYYRATIRECCYAVASGDETVTLRGNDGKTTVDDGWWNQLFDNLNAKQFDKLFTAAWLLDGEDAVPSSALDSATSQPDGESLKQPDLGASPRSGSAAGNRSKSRRTSTTKQGG